MNLQEGPSTEPAVVVDRGHPEGPRGADLGLLVLLALSRDLDDEAGHLAVAVSDADQEVGLVAPLLAVERVRNPESQTLALHVAVNLNHVLEGMGQLLLPRLGIRHYMGFGCKNTFSGSFAFS